MMNGSNILNARFFFLTALSFLLVAFGQPAWVSFLGILSAFFGFALFWRASITLPEKKQRFLFAFLWFSSVQLFQLSWFVSHPFSYIYAVWIIFSLAVGAQFGLLTLLLTEENITQLKRIFLVASIWTFIEWSRLFFLSGYVWNPVGLALASHIYSLQFASLVGVYGLSFYVVLMNLLALRAWLCRGRATILFVFAAVLPFLFGWVHYSYHEKQMHLAENDPSKYFSAILVQTAFPVEESQNFSTREELFGFVLKEWKQMLNIVVKHKEKPVQLIAFPEMVVPFGTYTFLYSHDDVKKMFVEIFGAEIIPKLPDLTYPLAYELLEGTNKQWMVNNAYSVQALANIFNASIVIGLEDAEDVNGAREYYSSAIHIIPKSLHIADNFHVERYSKRVLVPMGEYIPFAFCRDLAARYGVSGSFTPGNKTKVWQKDHAALGLSICYEEMFGDLMRESRQNGANIFLNLTSDAWFPNSKLIRQHLEHSRLRTVENGVPLLRACNTGVTCAVDSLGREIAVLGEKDHTREDLSDSLYVNFPIYHYPTLYARFGDALILAVCLICILWAIVHALYKSKKKS